MFCPNCKSANVLRNEDFDEYYCLVCNYCFALEIPTETPPESPQDDTERKELETLII